MYVNCHVLGIDLVSVEFAYMYIQYLGEDIYRFDENVFPALKPVYTGDFFSF